MFARSIRNEGTFNFQRLT